MQSPLFQARGLDLSLFFPGTLNISLAPLTVSLKQPQYTFRQVYWTTEHPPEDFSFSRCRVVVADDLYGGFIYYPHPETKKTHFQNASMMEIITTLIPNICYGDSIEVDINPDEIEITKQVTEADQDLEASRLPDASSSYKSQPR